MADITITEGEFKLPDGTVLYQKTWSPATPKAKLAHFHGFSDHINNYNDFFSLLARHGILCSGIDGRGWGRSAPKKSDRGNTGPTSLTLADMAAFIESQKTDVFPELPLFVSDHSMGGGLVATFASTPKYQPLVSSLRGILCLAPLMGLTPEQTPSSVTVFLGRLAGKVLPRFQLVEKMRVETLVRDPEVQRSLKEDPLNHATGTLEMFANMLDRMIALDEGKLVLVDGVQSVFLAHGTGDNCTSYDASKRWFEKQTTRVPETEKLHKSYDGWSHLLHSDLPENVPVYADDIATWILGRSAA
ncbi:alpha/beta-hydrolase [Aspergillus sclerotioniger CBS 115572]|uniref:Alpha/beta-hydrolase n=1 Tax=Aspergillus sclerotioniger CBS 115572 TaxID=1450535 RepID=A0A317V6X7_9EURO|nr:alpha/beta-hydrolase [Aspergillus sclerotioniger CBS 115572]PWY69011.1 alpha/beta-hydrolase [Aspergillus sclerotioniger CBS 115572]